VDVVSQCIMSEPTNNKYYISAICRNIKSNNRIPHSHNPNIVGFLVGDDVVHGVLCLIVLLQTDTWEKCYEMLQMKHDSIGCAAWEIDWQPACFSLLHCHISFYSGWLVHYGAGWCRGSTQVAASVPNPPDEPRFYPGCGGKLIN